MALGHWRSLSAMTVFAILTSTTGTAVANSTDLVVSQYDGFAYVTAFSVDCARIALAIPKAPVHHNSIDRIAVDAVPVTFGAKAEAVASKPEYFLFTEAGQAIAEWGRLRS